MREPFVSVVLAVRDEAAYIALCLNAVLVQKWPAERMEIIVADGESTDGTPDIIRALPGNERIQIIENPRRNQAAGLNLAIAHALGSVIVRVDGHTQIAPDYVRCCVEALEESDAACVGGRIHPVGLTPVGSVIAAVTRTAFAVPGAFHVSRTARYTDTVYLGAWPAMVLKKVGAFNEHLPPNEDYELAYRIRHAGGQVYLSPRIRSDYYGRQTLRTIARQYYLYGIGKAEMLLAYPRSLKARHLVAPLFVAGLASGPLCWYLGGIIWLTWLVMVAAYAMLNLGFSVFIALREHSVTVWLAPVVYLVIHVCWGVGVWVGLGRGIIRSLRSGERVASPVSEPLRGHYVTDE
jgi:succinoglycan biosynthesis protein ExoA